MPSMGEGSVSSSVRPALPSDVYLMPEFARSPVMGKPNKSAEATVYKALMSLASRPAYGVTLALAGTVSHSWHERGVCCLPLLGLDAETSYRVLAMHFPGIGRLMGIAWEALQAPVQFEALDELHDLIELLVKNRTVLDEDSTWLAHALATSCLGSNELWRDMNFRAGSVLDDLLHDFFTTFAVRNRKGMPWKQFFYNELALRAERRCA